MTAKKLLASVLVLLMLIGLVPMAALAAEDHTVQFIVDTSALGELNPGDVIQVPVKATVNDGFAGFGLVAVFSNEVFEKNGTNLFTAGEDIGSGYSAGDVAFYENADAENITPTGTMFYINLKVKEDAPAGSTSIGLAVLDDDPTSNFFYLDENYDFVGITTPFTPGTVTIAGETPAALTFTDGANTYHQ